MKHLGRLMLLVCRLAIGGLFAFAAASKLMGPAEFTVQGTPVKLLGPQQFYFSVRAFEILPDHLARLATFAIPWTEAACAVCLILGLWTRAAAWLISLTLVVFMVAIISAIQRHLSLSCGCFGSFKLFCGDTLGWCNVWQDLGMLVVALAPAVFGPGWLAVDGCARRAGAALDRPVPLT